MHPILRISMFALVLLTAAPCMAGESFDPSMQITNSVLTNVIANSNVTMDMAQQASFTGNNEVRNGFQGATGVVSIVQNSGVSSNVQQAVNVQIGSLTIGSLSLPNIPQ